MKEELSSSSSLFSLAPATRADIPDLVRVQVAACLRDNCFRLYFPSATAFTTWVADMLADQIGTGEHWVHIKAVDRATGCIGAWASWKISAREEEIRRADDGGSAPGPHAEDTTDTHTPNASDSGSSSQPPPTISTTDKLVFPPGLATHVHVATAEWLQRATRGRRHMVCKALFTDPGWQRRGMGTALVGYGARLADARGLPTFLQASPYGFPLYAAHGFDTVQHLDVDLRQWAGGAGGRVDDRGYGNYRFRFMVRLPVTVTLSG